MEALSRDCPIPIFSLRYSQEWTSFHGDPMTIPVEAMDFFNDFNYPSRLGKNGSLFDMDWSCKPIWADPAKHWCPFIPSGGFKILGEDPLSFLFEPIVVPTVVHLLDGKNGEDDISVLMLDDSFRVSIERLGKKLSETCLAMGGAGSFYGQQSDYRGGPVPSLVSSGTTAASAHRGLLDMLGFVSWHQAVTPLWRGWRSETDRVVVQCLLLQDRPKVGVLLSPARDYLFMHFPFLMKNKIPTHLIWREADSRFLKEFAEVKATLEEGQLVQAPDLPSYQHLWQPSLERYDVCLVDSLMGRNGAPSTGFDPKAYQVMVDWLKWGQRWVTDREEIRSYAELYHCASALHDSGRFITFFRQEPILQEDGYARPIPPKGREWAFIDI
ncbi:hypothetical protein C8J57DRAFT_1233807 [Mycena rebaudengoi]|nr:hypothetical protein C8J57DRAFT_1233807 [Mycena rebaudengoi]